MSPGRASRGPLLPVLLCCLGLLLGRSACAAQLLAKVEIGWSPFVRGPLPVASGRAANLFTEARRLLRTDLPRVAQVLARESLPAGRLSTFAKGLRADALYLLGGEHLGEAQTLYRAVVTQGPTPDEEAWAEFMLGNLQKVKGFAREAEVAFRASLRGDPAARPWRGAALFDLGALQLESRRPSDARVALETWLRERGDQRAGRAPVLYLLAESLAAAGRNEEALARFQEAQQLDPKAWVARPETGHAVAELYRRGGDPTEAARLLEMIPKAYPGTLEGARARLAVGEVWEAAERPALAVRSYGLLLDEGATPQEAKAASERLAFLGAENGPGLRLTEHYPAYKIYFRPLPVLEETARSGEPRLARRALRALGLFHQREGRPKEALACFARAFQGVTQGPEAGKAYDAYMDALEGTLAEKLRAGAYLEVVETYDAAKPAAGWTSLRDPGRAAVFVAEAYRALGTPRLARGVYEELRQKGSRAVGASEIEQHLAELGAEEGDYASLSAVVARRPSDWKLQRALARALARQGRRAEARDHYLKAAELSPQPADRLYLLTEADRLLEEAGRLDELLASLRKRRTVWEALPPGAERESWAEAASLTEGRVRFARADYPGAVEAFGRAAKLSSEDTYLLAVAEKRLGRIKRARELFGSLSQGADPSLAGLAQFQLQAVAAAGGGGP